MVATDWPCALQLDPRPGRSLRDIFLRLLERALQRLGLRDIVDFGKMRRDASGVQSDWARLMPSVSMILITANEPAPAPMMVRVGASSLSRTPPPA
jgi:hypothetical protein